MATQFQDPYAQMAKNTVDSRAQLKESHCVKLDRPDGRGVRVMFVGNSITLHGAKPDIGWHQEWGMAASANMLEQLHTGILPRSMAQTIIMTGRLRAELSHSFDELVEIMLNNI